MHPISDKELDKLFQQKFSDAQVEPSAGLWDKIAEKMDHAEKPRKSFSLLWMAASVVILISAGLWFYRPVQVIKLQGVQQMADARAIESPVLQDSLVMPQIPAAFSNGRTSFQTASVREDLKPEEPLVPETEPEITIEQAVVRSTPRRNVVAENPARSEVSVPRYSGDQSQLDVTQADMIAREVPADTEEPEYSPAKPSRRIKSIGSLVNYVIAKVDPRDDKIIEFKDGEEGSEVSGINLGLLRLKQRNK